MSKRWIYQRGTFIEWLRACCRPLRADGLGQAQKQGRNTVALTQLETKLLRTPFSVKSTFRSRLEASVMFSSFFKGVLVWPSSGGLASTFPAFPWASLGIALAFGWPCVHISHHRCQNHGAQQVFTFSPAKCGAFGHHFCNIFPLAFGRSYGSGGNGGGGDVRFRVGGLFAGILRGFLHVTLKNMCAFPNLAPEEF